MDPALSKAMNRPQDNQPKCKQRCGSYGDCNHPNLQEGCTGEGKGTPQALAHTYTHTQSVSLVVRGPAGIRKA